MHFPVLWQLMPSSCCQSALFCVEAAQSMLRLEYMLVSRVLKTAGHPYAKLEWLAVLHAEC